MKVGLYLYRLATGLVHPFLSHILRRRVRAGKEYGTTLPQRYARGLPKRPDGNTPLIWFHGASIGESQMLLGLKAELEEQGAVFQSLFTVQTQTGYQLLTARTAPEDLVTLAAIDTPLIARRFVNHWAPDLALFGEGEIWPNLLDAATRRGSAIGLVNARLTEASLKRWKNWSKSARHIFSAFDFILASDTGTARGLSDLTGRDIPAIGNLKTAISANYPTKVDENQLARITIPKTRKCLLLASTHEGEEDLILAEISKLKEPPFLIIAPRHPERAQSIITLLDTAGLTYARRSTDDQITPQHDVLLADTIGEMALWYHTADIVYLGGGHAPGIGGHNPMEAAISGKPILTGPDTFNFAELMDQLAELKIIHITKTTDDITALLSDPPTPPNPGTLRDFFDQARSPMDITVRTIMSTLAARSKA